MDVRSTFKADETVARSWLRGLLIAHPFAAVLTSFALGIVVSALILGAL